MKTISIKSKLILFLIAFAVFIAVKDKDFLFLKSLLFTTVLTVLIESAIVYFKSKKFSISESSIITGLIIGFVLSSDNKWWVLAVACIIAIVLKHIVRFNDKHIFNPAASGIFLSMIILGATTVWRGTYIWYILAPFGIYFIYKIKKDALLWSYFLTAFILFAVQAIMQNVSLLNIFWYFSYFFILVMLIEPKTTPNKTSGQIIFGVLAAFFIYILIQANARLDVELFSLLVLNLSTQLLNKLGQKKVRLE